MPLKPRDRVIVRQLDYFNQLTTAQILALAFRDVSSRTPCDRAIKRLLEGGFIHRVPSHGPQGVYMLGRQGWALCKREGRWNPKAVDYHSLAIADAYIRLLEASYAGKLVLLGFTPEPECHRIVDGNHLKPDIYVETDHGGGRILREWLEIDMGTERQARITEKIERYTRAMNYKPKDDTEKAELLEPFPRVVFVAYEEERVKELSWLISRLPKDDRRAFYAVNMASYPQLFS